MSPEQAGGDRALDGRSDIYSLGCVLYEMLTGEPPHTGPTVQAVIAKLLADKVRPVTELRSTVPVAVAAALEVALAKLPADRFASVGAFAGALSDPSATALGLAPAHRQSKGRSTTAPQLVLLTAVAVVIGALAAWGWIGRATHGADGQVLHLPLTLRDPPRTREGASVQLSPRGDRLAYRSTAGWRIVDLRTGENRPLLREVSALRILFSPSGDSIALNTGGRLAQVLVADVETGRTSRVADCCYGLWHWDDDGWIYHRDITNSLVRTNTDGRREVLEPPGRADSWGVTNALAVPGGHGVIFVRPAATSRDPASAEVVAKDLSTGETKVLSPGVEALLTPSGYLLVAQSDGRLLAARFDTGTLRVVGQMRVVLENLLVTLNATGGGVALSFARDGTLLTELRRPFVEDTVIVVDRQGDLVGPPRTWGGWVHSLSLSADAARWALSMRGEFGVPNIWGAGDSGRARRLTFSDNLDYYPRWVPNTQQLLFVGSTAGRNWDLYRLPFDGGAEPELLLDREGDIQFPRLSYDGKTVVFCDRGVSGQTDIFQYRFGEDSARGPLVGTTANECGPDMSPDGRWLAYEVREAGKADVFVSPMHDSAGVRWQVTQGEVDDRASASPAQVVRTPRWSSTGRELFYVNSQRELVAVPVTAGRTFSFGEPRVLFSLDSRTDWSGEVLSDGRGFILIRRVREATGQIMMIRNFDRLLREKLGG